MNKKVKILIFCMIFVVSGVFGQNALYNFGFKQIEVPNLFVTDCFAGRRSTTKIILLTNLKTYKEPTIYSTSKNFAKLLFSNTPHQALMVIAPNYYTQNFGFFCKKELQFEKIFKTSLKLRLGSLEMCDRMEGKNR